jgi:hypothetical protein
MYYPQHSLPDLLLLPSASPQVNTSLHTRLVLGKWLFTAASSSLGHLQQAAGSRPSPGPYLHLLPMASTAVLGAAAVMHTARLLRLKLFRQQLTQPACSASCAQQQAEAAGPQPGMVPVRAKRAVAATEESKEQQLQLPAGDQGLTGCAQSSSGGVCSSQPQPQVDVSPSTQPPSPAPAPSPSAATAPQPPPCCVAPTPMDASGGIAAELPAAAAVATTAGEAPCEDQSRASSAAAWVLPNSSRSLSSSLSSSSSSSARCSSLFRTTYPLQRRLVSIKVRLAGLAGTTAGVAHAAAAQGLRC